MHWYFQVRVGVIERASSRVLQVLETQRTCPVQFHAQQCHDAMHLRFLVEAEVQHASRVGYLLQRLPSVSSAHWVAVEEEEDEHQLWNRTALASFAPSESAVDTNPDSPWWQSAPSTVLLTDNEGLRVPRHDTEVRLRWTRANLYVLFDCAYHHLSLRQGEPTLQAATAELWANDVAEVFLGYDSDPLTRYMEYEVSPRGEWIDLDITAGDGTISSSRPLRSGFQAAARIYAEHHRWLAFLRIPLSTAHDFEAHELRINLFRSQGPGPVELAWQPTYNISFHVPGRFGYLRCLPA